MHVFLTGANGWIGTAIAEDLIEAGHSVTGLVRSRENAETLARRGVKPLVGGLADHDVLRAGASGSDGIVHTAFGLDLSKIAELAEEERRAIETFGDAFQGSARPIIVTGGVLLMPRGEVFDESARPPVDPAFPRASEQTAFALAERGLHACVVRNPRSVHGQGERHGFVPMLAAVARRTGVSAYVEDGSNLWPTVHRLDAARVYRLALERGARGEAFHAIAEEGVPFKAIAEAIGRQVGVPARSLSRENAESHFGGLAVWVAGHGPASSGWTRTALGWEPKEPALVADIERRTYSE